MDLKLEKALDTTNLIAEINYLAKEIDDCILPKISHNDVIKDFSLYVTGQIYDKCGLVDNMNGGSSSSKYLPSEIILNCYRDIEGWRQNVVNKKLIDRLLSTKPKELKRKKPERDIEADIRRQRQKYNEMQNNSEDKNVVEKKFHKQWKSMIKKEMGKSARQRISVRKDKLAGLKRAARECAKLCRQKAVASNKCAKDALSRGRKLAREIAMCWKNLDKEEKISKKKLDRQAIEQKRKNLELLEAKRQQRKLNYLITQTELYTHFMSKKMSNSDDEELENKEGDIMNKLDEICESNSGEKDADIDKEKALENVRLAVEKQAKQASSFYSTPDNPMAANTESLFQGKLKSYQEHGRQWLLHLFEQGINGILADEMGLGKTVQTMAFLTTLAEKYDLWGPFLVIAPASTVHNWAQELAKFAPCFKVVPYWGNVAERKILRRFWNSNGNSKTNGGDISVLGRDSSYHIVVTSYQVVLQDAKMVGRVKWQYLVLDEAHAIKNTASQRWNTLLAFDCRNRLLLTGTPIQNTMQELWALLHFIMPTLFDSHDEFNEWFSKDIESHAAASAASVSNNTHTSTVIKSNPQQQLQQQFATTRLTATQLGRLHLILQPFMLRRVKAEVEHELPKKIEKLVYCQLSSRQSSLYERLKRRIRIDDLSFGNVQNSNSNFDSTIHTRQQRSLLNLLMQLRKVCNHPDLVEPRQEIFSVHTRFLPAYYECPRLVHEWITERHYNVTRSPQLCINSPLYIWELFKKTWGSVYDGTGNQMSLLWLFKLQYWWQQSLCTSGYSVSIDKYKCNVWCGPKPIMASPIKLAVHQPGGRIDDALRELRQYVPCWSNRLGECVKLVSQSLRISDSCKLAQLDALLCQLKKEGHRVLVYSQMTRMIDLIEELMRWRRLRFSRLDGSSRLCDRRDMVAEFQRQDDENGEEIFAFLLSTRAGGLGINLTAADTVIFFDSDWNPAVDEQAMDRAHRLGQDKPVTVYRLVCEATVEKQILARAEEKRHMQRMVIAGMAASNNNETENSTNNLMISGECVNLKARDVASLLLADDEVRARLEEKRKFGGVINNSVAASPTSSSMRKSDTDIKREDSYVLGTSYGVGNGSNNSGNNSSSGISRKRRSTAAVASAAWQALGKSKRSRLSASSNTQINPR